MTSIYHKIKGSNMNIVKEYLNFRLANITSEELLAKSLEQLCVLMDLDPAQHLYPLLKAHLSIVCGKKDNVVNILGLYEKSEKELIESEPFIYAYYIYLKCLFLEDKQLQQKANMIIAQVADRSPADWRPQWLRLYLDENINRNKQTKLTLLQNTYHNQCRSPIIYFELCTLLNENPTMLRSLEGFELQSLWWGVNNNYINNELAIKIIIIAQRATEYKLLVYKLLVKLYETHPGKELAKAACNILIIGEQKTIEANKWYKRCMEEEIRLTGLYEYYIESIDKEDMSMLPQPIIRYFVYNTSICDESREYIYANIIKNQTMQTMESYGKQILLYAQEQLRIKKINDFLVKIYLYIIRSQKETSSFILKLLDVAFKHKLICNNEKITKAIITYTDLAKEEIVSLKDGSAYINIYSPNYFISFVDREDNIHSEGILYHSVSVINDLSFVEKAYEDNIYNDMSLIYLISKSQVMNEKIILKVLEIKSLSATYRSKLALSVLKETANNLDPDSCLLFLKAIDLTCLSYNDVVEVIKYYIHFKMVEESIHSIKEYTYKDIPVASICSLCEQVFYQGFYDDTMISMCEWLVAQGNCDNKVIGYLVRFYDSSLTKLKKIWEKAKELGFNTTSLEERIIEQMLFTESIDKKYMAIVENYSMDNITSPLMDTFLKFSAFSFLLGIEIIPNQVMKIMRKSLKIKGDNTLYEYTLAKFYSMQKELSSNEIKWVEQIALKLYKQKRLVSWFKNYGPEVNLPSGVKERSYIEYFSSSISTINLYYRYSFEENYNIQEMKQVAEGLFVGNVLLFFNESFQYYIEEKSRDKTNIVSSERLVIEENEEICNYDKNSANYELINSMLIARNKKEDEKLDKIIQQYIDTDNKIATYFKPL